MSRSRHVRDLAVMLTLGVVGSFFFMLLPLVVAALMRDGYPAQAAGLVGAAPLAGMFVGSIVCAATLQRLRRKPVSLLALFVMVAAHAITASAPGRFAALLAVQFLAGFAGVVLMSLTFAFISRQAVPDRYFALFIALQMASGALATVYVERITDGGASPVFGFLAICAACAIPLASLVPAPRARETAQFAALAGAARLVTSSGGVAVLATQVLFGAGIMLIWSSAARIGDGHGLPSALVARALSFSLSSSILGALCASAIGRRIRVEATVAAGSTLLIVAAMLAASAEAPAAFFAAIALFCFGWNFLPPFQLGIAADLDSFGRLVILSIALVKLGYALGTAAAGVLASLGGYAPHSLAASACFVAALLTAIAARRAAIGSPTPGRPASQRQ